MEAWVIFGLAKSQPGLSFLLLAQPFQQRDRFPVKYNTAAVQVQTAGIIQHQDPDTVVKKGSGASVFILIQAGGVNDLIPE